MKFPPCKKVLNHLLYKVLADQILPIPILVPIVYAMLRMRLKRNIMKIQLINKD